MSPKNSCMCPILKKALVLWLFSPDHDPNNMKYQTYSFLGHMQEKEESWSSEPRLANPFFRLIKIQATQNQCSAYSMLHCWFNRINLYRFICYITLFFFHIYIFIFIFFWNATLKWNTEWPKHFSLELSRNKVQNEFDNYECNHLFCMWFISGPPLKSKPLRITVPSCLLIRKIPI